MEFFPFGPFFYCLINKKFPQENFFIRENLILYENLGDFQTIFFLDFFVDTLPKKQKNDRYNVILDLTLIFFSQM